MAIASTVENYLQENRIPYMVVPHRHTSASKDTAATLHVPAERVAKAVVLTGNKGNIMVVLPSNRHIDVMMLSQTLGRDLTLASEQQLAAMFKDCDLGAIPPLGRAYGMPTIMDDGLVGQPEIYFEAGDHEEVIRVDGEQFLLLLKDAQHGRFSH